MKWFADPNAGSTATPTRPRSPSSHTLAVRSIAGVVRTEPFLITDSLPALLVTRIRPSGVKAMAVGLPTLATNWSAKPAGRTEAADAVSTNGTKSAGRAVASRTVRVASGRRRRFGPISVTLSRPRAAVQLLPGSFSLRSIWRGGDRRGDRGCRVGPAR